MGRKILLADDSITIQKVVNLTFSGEGIDVVAVGNGEVAIRKLNDVKPDLVLADVYMPGKNGYEVCEYIKTNPQFSRLPVLLLVGAFEPFDQAEAARVKADGHLTKPFESRTLIATVNRLLAQAPPPQQTESTAPPVRQQHLPPAGTVIRPNPTTVPSQYLSPEPPPMQSRPGTTPPAGVSNFPTSQFGFSTPVEGKPPVTKTEGFPGMLRPEAPEPPSFALDFNVSEEVPQQVQQTPPIKVPQRKLADFSAHFETEDMFEQTISIGVSELPKLQPQISQEPVGHTAESVDYDEAPLELEPLEEYSFQADSESLLEISDTSSVEAPQPSFEVSTPILEVPPVSQKVQEYEFVPTPTAWDVQESAASIPEQKFEFEAPVAEAEVSQGEVLETQAAVEEQRAEFEFEAPVAEAEISQGEVLETQAAVEEQRAEFEFEAPVAEAEVSQGEVLETQAAVEEQRAEFEFEAPVAEAEISQGEVLETQAAVEEQRAEFEFEAPVAEAEVSQGEVLETQAAVEEQRAEFEFEAPVAEAEISQGEVLETQAAVEEQRAEFEFEAPVAEAEISQGEVLETQAAVEEQRAEFEFEAPVAEAEISQGEVLETQAAVEEQRAEFEFEAPVAEAEVSQGEVLETQAAVEEQRAEFETPAASEAQLAASEVAETRSGLEGGVLSTADRQVSGFETSYEAERSVVDAVPGYTARTDVSSAPMPAASVVVDLKNLTLDQIPQQLIDEIVRRTIAQMSENVVREIAWEVVPDLAELLIKKKLEGRL